MKILLIGNTRLGDAILSTCILNYYSSKDVDITVVCSSLSKEIYQTFTKVKNIITVVKKKRGKHWLEVYKKLDKIKWDLVIDLRNTIISRIIRKRKIVRLTKRDRNEHKVVSMCKLIGLNYNIAPEIPITEEDKLQALKLIKRIGMDQGILVISPVTNWKRKNWPLKNFALLINKIIKKNSNFKSIVLLGSKNEIEACRQLKAMIKNFKVFNMSGKYDLKTISAILSHSELFIGNDSGLMHLAAASKIKTLGLFGPSREANYRPWGKNSYYLRTEKSYEELVLHKAYNRHLDSSLMTSLTVAKVYKKYLKIL